VKNSSGTPFFIAIRYLFSPKKYNIINIISIISVLGIMASSAALVIVLSVFNGMQELVVSNFNRFNPPLILEAKEGKLFSLENGEFLMADLENIAGVKAVEQVLSDLVLITYHEKQTLSTLYGVSAQYAELSGLEDMTIDGFFDVGSENGAVFGAGVAVLLGIELNSYDPVKIYYPKRNKKNLANPMEAFHIANARPAGVFESYTPYDENSLFVPQKMAKEILDVDKEVSSLAIYINENHKLEKIQKQVTQIVGNNFTVKNQMQQEVVLFKTIQAENLIVFLILGFIFILATFNIIGSLGMLIIEKEQDISILHTLGASKALLKKIFLIVGIMIGTFGGLLGMCIGLVCCVLQQTFGIISLGNAESSYIITAYPVSLSLIDFVVVFFLIVSISLITSSASLRGLKNNYLINKY